MPSPQRPTRGELAWLFGPFVVSLLVVGATYATGGSDAVRRYGLLLMWPLFGLAFLGSLRAPRRRGAAAPPALAVTRLRGRPAFAAAPVYRVMCPRLGGLLAYWVMMLAFLAHTRWMLAITGLLVGATIAEAIRLARGVPTIALTAEGIVRGYPVRRTLAWGEVESVVLRVAGVRTALDIRATGRRWKWTRPEVTTGVDLVYLMNVIRHYADHPQERAAIGEVGEQDRVYALLPAERSGAGESPDSRSVHSGPSATTGEPR
jgi:hypothetical protein